MRSAKRPDFLHDLGCSPIAESCCDQIEIEASGALSPLSGIFVKGAETYLGRPIYRRSPSAAPITDDAGSLYDELMFTHESCGEGLHNTASYRLKFPHGLGVILSGRIRGQRPHDDILSSSDRRLDFAAALSNFEGLKLDSVSGPGLSGYATLSDLPGDVCTNSTYNTARESLYYLNGGVHSLLSFNASNQNVFATGPLFQNCTEDVVCASEAMRKCDSVALEGGSIVKWGCHASSL